MTKRQFALRAMLVASASSIALTAAPVWAQGGGLDTIIVTAQKREENQQEVPISVATVSQSKLNTIFSAGEDIRALANRVPGLYAESSNGRVAPRFYIRGLGNVDFDLAASQPVSIIMDEVVLENVALKSFPIFDIDQIEVLRGPQGTLFGRNTPAGIVKFASKKPSQEFDARANLTYGNYNTFNVDAAVGGPLGDSVSARASFLYQHRDDWIDNTFTGVNDALGGYDEIAGRIQFLFEPTENFSALVNVHARSLDGTASVFRANIIGPGNNNLNANFDRDTVQFDAGDNNPQEYDGFGASLNLSYDIGDATITSITAYEEADGRSLGDIDGGFGAVFLPVSGPGFIPFPAETQDSADVDQLTQELRIASNTSGPFNWQFGGYFFTSDLSVTTIGPNGGFPPETTVFHENTAWAIFGQGSYDLSDRFTMTAGVRYTDDDKDFFVPMPPPTVTVNPTNASDDNVSWDVSGLYRVNDGVNIYGRVARGFRAPTIQGRDVSFAAFSGAVDPQSVAMSETILSFEGGFKSEFANNRARLNATAFYYEIDNQQFSIIGGVANTNQVINADKGVGWGFEADAEFLLTDNFHTTFGFSYNNTEIKDSTLATAPCGSGLCTVLDPLNALGQAIVDGNPFPQAPKITFNATAEYTIPFRDHGEFFVFTDWAIQGETNFLLYESAEFRSNGNFEGGLRVGYRHGEGGVEAALFARNITDEKNLKGGIDFNNLTGFVNEPRIFGFQLILHN